mgnify:CR=1 FL=1
MKCGLLGKTLGHSYSPDIHAFLGEYSYELFEKQPSELEDFLKNGSFTGLNVTMPYKKDVIPYCDILTDRAKKLGAVNTLVKKADGTLLGHNTDYFGFQSMLDRMGLTVEGKKVLMLGSGGASATAVAVLQESGANVVVISRTGANNYGNIELHRDAAVIVNATPVGMYPNAGTTPVDLSLFSSLEGVLDIVYNPARTRLMLDAEAMGIPTKNGLWMLVAQAKEASEWFTGNKLDDCVIEKIHSNLRKKMENIVLIGMPGCGKSTIGQIVADTTGKTLVDIDAEIERASQMSIPDIFTKHGEEYFRKLETKTLAAFGQKSGLVIATGGGCVTREKNYSHLHQNGTIYWLQRDINELPIDGRPLSQTGKLNEMYIKRKPMYTRFADAVILNDADPGKAAAEIAKGWL